MGKYFFILLFAGFLLNSCSKERHFNRKLDGEWVSSVFFGESPNSDEEFFFSFSKDNKGDGDGFLRISDGFTQHTLGLSYYISQDKITMIIDSEPYSFTIKSYSRRKIELVDTYDAVTILEKD